MTPHRSMPAAPANRDDHDRSRPRRGWLALCALLALLIAGLGFGVWQAYRLYGPELTRERLEAGLTAALGRPVRIERVILRPWLGRLDLVDVTVPSGTPAEPAPILRAAQVEVRVGISSLWRREVVLSRILLRDLTLHLRAASSDGPAPVVADLFQESLPIGPIRLALRAIQVQNGEILYRDPPSGRVVTIVGLEGAARRQAGGIALRLGIARLAVQAGTLRQVAEQVEGDGRALPGLLLIRTLRARWNSQELRLTGDVRNPFQRPRLDLHVHGRLDLSRLTRMVQVPWPLAGMADVTAAVQGQPDRPEISAQATMPDLSVGPVRARVVAMRGDWNWDRVEVTLLHATAFGGDLHGSLRARPSRPDGTRLSLQIRQASLDALGSLSPSMPGVRGLLDIDVEATGDPRRLDRIQGNIRLAASRVHLPEKLAPMGAGRVSADATFQNAEVQLSRATGDWPGIHLDATGAVTPSGPVSLGLGLSADLAALGDLASLPGLSGEARLSVQAQGSWAHPVLAGRLTAATVSIHGTRIDRVAVPFRVAGTTLSLEAAEGTIGQSQVGISGTAAWDVDLSSLIGDPQRNLRLHLEVRAPSARWEDLAPWLPPAGQGAGRFSLAARLDGPPAAYRIAGTLEGGDLRASHAIPIQSLRATFRGDPHGLQVERVQARVRDIPLDGRAAWSWGGAGQAEAELGPADLHQLPNLPPQIDLAGSARGRLQLTWRESVFTGTGTLDVTHAGITDLAMGDGTIRLEMQQGQARATLAFPHAGIAGTLTGRLDPTAPLLTQLQLQDLNLTPLLRHLAGASGLDLSGSVTGRAELRIPLSDPTAAQGTASLDRLHLLVAGEPWSNRGPVALGWTAGGLRVQRLVLASRLGELAASGSFLASGPIDLEAHGRFPLALLPLLAPGIREAGGSLDLNAKVGGTLAAPILQGDGTVSNGRIQLHDFPEVLRDLQAHLLFSPSGLRLVEATGSLGGGRLRLGGELNLQGRQVALYRFVVTGEGVALPPLEGLRSTWDLDLSVTGVGSRTQVTGRARLVRGIYTGKLSLLSALLPKSSGGPAPSTFVVPLRIQLQLDDNLAVQTDLAQLQVGGSLSLEGTTARPILFGTLESHEGRITFRGNRFQVSSASAHFADPRRIDPDLNILATTRIRDYDVSLHLSGRAEDLRVGFTSAPPLGETELLSLVTLGVTPQELGHSAPGIVGGEIAGLLVRQLLGEQASAMGLNRLELGTAQVGGQQQAQVGAHITQNIRIQYSQSLTASNRRALQLEYQVIGPLFLTGEQDFQGGYGGGFLLRLRFR